MFSFLVGVSTDIRIYSLYTKKLLIFYCIILCFRILLMSCCANVHQLAQYLSVKAGKIELCFELLTNKIIIDKFFLHSSAIICYDYSGM